MVENPKSTKRAEHEKEFGEFLASADPESIWGWGTPAGKERAKRRAGLIIEKSGLGSDKIGMEIGCGTGMFTEMFVDAGGEIFAVDISPDLIKIAKDRQLPEDKIHFICERFEDVQHDEPFDVIIGSSVLHHLNIEEALEAMFRLLKPGGKIAFAEPNMVNPQIFMEKVILKRWLDSVSPDETAIVRWKFKRLLLSKGFVNVEITPFDWLHPLTPSKLISFVKKIGSIIEVIPGVRELSGSLIISAKKPME